MDTETQRKEGHMKTGRGWNNVSTRQEITMIASSFQKLRGKSGTDSLSEPLEGTNMVDTLISGL